MSNSVVDQSAISSPASRVRYQVIGVSVPTQLQLKLSVVGSRPSIAEWPAVRFLTVFTAILSSFGQAADYPAFPKTVVEGAQLEKIFSEDTFFEGPTWDPKGQRLYFTAFGKEKDDTSIRVWDPRSLQTRRWTNNTEGTNGTLLTPEGTLLGAQYKRRRLIEYSLGSDSEESPASIATVVNEPGLNAPNDVTLDQDGFFYFSDPDFANQKKGGVYRFTRAGIVERLPGELILPNGLDITRDGKILVVGDSATKKWYAYDLQLGQAIEDMKPPRVFFDPDVDDSKAPEEGLPDGMCLDDRGNFYLTGRGGIWCVDRNGVALGYVPVPEFVSNVCFGGVDGKTLFATCQGGVYKLKMQVAGQQIGPLNRWLNPPVNSSGPLTHASYKSLSMGVDVGFSYWLPPGYEDSPNRHYPVLYWLHGLGGNESAREYPIGSLATKISISEIPPMIFVQVNGGARSVYADSYDGKNLAETTIIEELIPHIDSRFRTLANRGGRSIQGMSMGGEGALRFAAKYPQHFGSVLAYAGGFVSHSELQRYRPRIYDEMFDRRPERFERSMASTYLSENAGTVRQQVAIRLLCGTADESIHLQRHIARLCKEKDIAIEAIEVSGAQHDFRQLILRTDSDDFSFAAKHFAIP